MPVWANLIEKVQFDLDGTQTAYHLGGNSGIIRLNNMPYNIFSSNMIGRTLRCLMPVVCFTGSLISQDRDQASNPSSRSVVRARAIVGLEGNSNNAAGELSIQDDTLVFQPSGGAIARIPIVSLQDVFLSQEDKQVGGTPMAVGRTATPFGGGRVIGLFAHKKYDFVTFEYLDSNGGFHGVMFQLNKGQGQALGDELETKGVHVSRLKGDTAKQRQETKNEVK